MIRRWLMASLLGLMSGVTSATPTHQEKINAGPSEGIEGNRIIHGDSLKILFSGISSSEGKLLIEIRNSAGEAILGTQIPASPNAAGEQTVTFSLDIGTYAVAAFHDRNNNGDIDFNWLGAPTERYGFSNNARGLFSEPDLADQLFKFSSTDVVHRIHLH